MVRFALVHHLMNVPCNQYHFKIASENLEVGAFLPAWVQSLLSVLAQRQQASPVAEFFYLQFFCTNAS